MESRHLQGCSPRLCRLRTEGLAPVSKYRTYRSHAGDMGPVSRGSLLANGCLAYAYCFNGCHGRETEVGPADRSAGVLGIVSGALFLGSSRIRPTLLGQCKRLSYADGVREAYGRVSYADQSRGNVCRVDWVSPAGCTSIRIAATLGYE